MVRPRHQHHRPQDEDAKMKTIILAQAIISAVMCCLMSGYATLLQFGFTMEWLGVWSHAFVIAWPVAFLLSMIVGRAGFALAHKLLPQAQAAH